jgi:HK97 family phage major capsid protein
MNKKQLQELLTAKRAELSALLTSAETSDNPVEALAAVNAKKQEVEAAQANLAAREAIEAEAKANATAQLAASGQAARVVADNEAKRPFANFGEQLFAVACAQSPAGSFGGQGGMVDKRLYEVNLAASGLNSTVPTEGGFLVATDFSTAILNKAAELGKIAPRCFTIPISDGFDGVELPYIDETSRATGSRWGGVRVYRAGETDAPTSAKPKFNRMELKLESLKGLAYISERQLRNSAATSTILQNAFSSEFAFVKDNEVWRGNGVGECLGFSVQAHEGTALMVSVAKKSGQTAATFVIENATAMLSRLYADPGDNIVWLLNRDCTGQLPLMTIGQQPVFLPNMNASGSPFYGTLLGYPIVIVEQAETLGTAGDVVLANLSKYAVIQQGGMRSATSMHVRFIYDEMAFKWSHDFNGQSIVKKPITPFKGSATLSPFVTTAVRA